jgi:excinuclease ABC subunit A
LLAAGHSVIVIEHNIDFIAQADYLVDLGPEGGDGGGQIVAQGTVDDVMQVRESQTGHFLKKRLQSLSEVH